ncbi:MAG TPA: type 1 glutamine amidotransferase [Thermoanaerobaculia bacterium]|nr:type 1 glutamine amidotransferase [Thermoanaerobaculia bacterium]
MGKPRSQVRLFLIQVRDHDEVAGQERACFLRHCRLEAHQMRWHNVVEDPVLTWRHVEDADVLMIGGAGAHSVTHDDDFTPALIEVFLRWLEEGRPFFGSCWGHQFIGRALGGTVITDPAGSEVGTFDLELTAEGERDPLLAGLPRRFAVQLGHNDRIDQPPPGLVALASSERCRLQLVRLADRPVYGSQFHSEMGEQEMRRRAKVYQDRYLGDDDAYAAFVAKLRPSPEADGLLDRFLSLYV